MNIYTCTDFTGFWPVGTAAYVVAPDADTACALLNAALVAHGLPGGVTSMQLGLADCSQARATILLDGEY